MTAEEFEKVTGRPPENDDLERATCDKAGEVGHFQCGMCQFHKQPRFICGCVLQKPAFSKAEVHTIRLTKHVPDELEIQMTALNDALREHLNALNAGALSDAEQNMLFEDFFCAVRKIFIKTEKEN